MDLFHVIPLEVMRYLVVKGNGAGNFEYARVKIFSRPTQNFSDYDTYILYRDLIRLGMEILPAVDADDTVPKHPLAPKAVEEAYSRHKGELRRFFRRMSRRTELSDDLVQEVYLELLRYPPRDTLREPQAFLYKIAWNVVNRSNALEQRHVPANAEAIERVEALAAECTGDAMSELDAEQRILRVLGQLPPLYGAALVLWKRDGLAYSEIGKQLGISAHTVRKYLTRAMAHVKQANWDE